MSEVDTHKAIQRVRIGLTGLAFVFLLVLLGTVIADGEQDPVGQPSEATNSLPDEPLAELGVAPKAEVGDNEAAIGGQ